MGQSLRLDVPHPRFICLRGQVQGTLLSAATAAALHHRLLQEEVVRLVKALQVLLEEQLRAWDPQRHSGCRS